MEINRNNYEAFLLDLMEGKLSVEEKQKIRDFLKMNPDCAMLNEETKPWILETAKVTFSGKEQLKKELPDSGSKLSNGNFDLFSIARLEGDLTTAQEMEHQAKVESDKQRIKEWQVWKQTKLQAQSVIFPGKQKLKKSTGINRRVIWLSLFSAAATVALLFTLLRNDEVLPEMEIAVETPNQIPVIEVPQTESVPLASQAQEITIAVADEPVMFSIKKNPDRPIESPQKQDTMSLNQPRKVEARAIRLAGNVSYATDALPESPYDQIKALDIPPSDIYISSLTLAQISEIDLQEAIEDYTEEKNISLWSIANSGIKGINKITGSEISLLATRDDEGDVSGFRLRSKRFSLSRPLDQSE